MNGGGTFSGPGISGTSFDPSIAGAGTHTIIYTYSDGNACSAASSQSVTVNPLPSAAFTGLAGNYCLNSALVTLYPSVSGGTFTGPGISGNTFNAAIAGVGSHIIHYNITDVNGCSNSFSQSVQVNLSVDASFTGPIGSFCSTNNVVLALTPTVSGGVFSGPGVIGNTWSPINANVGNNTISYNISSAGCSSTSTLVVNVLPSPNANFTPLNDVYCNNEAPIVLIPVKPGGVFTATAVGLFSNTFYPQLATIGTNIITYTISSANGCSNSFSDTVVVAVAPVSTISVVNDTILSANVVGPSITYQWMNCQDQTPIVEENGPVINVGQYEVYSVVVFDGVCGDTSGCIVVYFADLETILDEKDLKVYPNPNNGHFKIETSFDAKIEINNSLGQLVYREEHVKGQSEINLGNAIETGMYIVKFTNKNGSSVYRNIVVRN